MSGHTPGPWLLAASGKTIWFGNPADDGFCIVDKIADRNGHTYTTEAETNARLISAAPDLLEACELTMRMKGVLPPATVAALRAAILKATGQQP